MSIEIETDVIGEVGFTAASIGMIAAVTEMANQIIEQDIVADDDFLSGLNHHPDPDAIIYQIRDLLADLTVFVASVDAAVTEYELGEDYFDGVDFEDDDEDDEL